MPVHPVVSEYLAESEGRRIRGLEERIAALESTIRSLTRAINVAPGGGVQIQATTLNVDASSIRVNTPLATFTGVVQCETIRATTVMGTTYTPGAGNVW